MNDDLSGSSETLLTLSEDMKALSQEEPAIVQKLVDLFFDNGVRLMDGVSMALTEDDTSAALAKVHSLKSSVGQFGESRTFASLKAFEAGMKVGGAAWGREHIASLLNDFEGFLGELRRIFRRE